MSNTSHQQLIYDLVDGQLSTEQIQRAQQLIANDPKLASLYETLRHQQTMLRDLPQHSLDDSFADQVVRAAEAEGLFAQERLARKEATVSTPKTAGAKQGFSNWRGAAAAIIGLAALLLISLFVIPPQQQQLKTAANSESAAGVDKEAGDDDAKDKVAPIDKSVQEVGSKPLANVENSQKRRAETDSSPKQAAGLMAREDAASPEDQFAAEADVVEIDTPGGALRLMPGSRAAPEPPAPFNDTASIEVDNLKVEGARQGGGFSDPNEGVPQNGELTLGSSRGSADQILFVSLNQDQKSWLFLQESFKTNGLEIEWAELQPEFFQREGDEAPGEDIDPTRKKREFRTLNQLAFNVRTTPEKMRATMLQLRGQADVVGVDSQHDPRRLGDDSVADNPEIAYATRLRTFQLAQKESDGNKAPAVHQQGQQKSESADGPGFSEIEKANQIATEEEKRVAQEIRELNQFFRLDPETGSPQLKNYTLVIRFEASPEVASPFADVESAESQQADSIAEPATEPVPPSEK